MLAALFPNPADVADVFRYIAMSLGVLICGWAVAIIHYGGLFRAPSWPIRLAAASYITLEVALIVEVHELLGTPGTWRTPVVLIANLLGVATMGVMSHEYEPHRRARRHLRLSHEAAERMIADNIQERRRRRRRSTDPDPNGTERRHGNTGHA